MVRKKFIWMINLSLFLLLIPSIAFAQDEFVRPDPPKVDEVTDVTQKVTGTAEAYTTVVVKKDGNEIARTRAYKNGYFGLNIPVQKANTVLTFTATNANGIPSLPTEVKVKYTKYFTDTIDHWAKNGIGYLKGEGIALGLPDGSFGVNKNITRGEAAAFLARTLKLDTENVKNPNFPDVPVNHPYFPAIAAIFEEGIISGNTRGFFEPDHSLTRAEMAVILVKGFDLEKTQRSVSFTDVPQTHWAYDAIRTLASNRIASGYPDGSFGSNKPITRAEFASLLANVLQKQ